MFRTVSVVSQSAKGRAFSTASVGGYTYQTSQLKNGLRVVSASTPSSPVASVGLYLNGGSRLETAETLGATGVFRRLAFKGSEAFPELTLTREFELLPATFDVAVGREQVLLSTEFAPEKLAQALQLLNNASAIEAREYAIRLGREDVELDTMSAEADTRTFILDALHREAYRNGGLGRSIFSPSHRIHHLGPQEIEHYLKSISANGATLVATGNISHSELVRDAEGAFSQRAWGQGGKATPSKYEGGEFKLNADSETTVGLAFEGAAQGSAEEFSSALLRVILGGGRKHRDYGIGQGHTSRLYKNVIQSGQAVESVESFNFNYTDSGLIGLIANASSGKARAATHELTSALSTFKKSPITEEELKKAKEGYKAETLIRSETRSGLSEFLASQHGQAKSPADYVAAADKVTAEELNKFARKVFNSQPTLAVVGNDVEGVPSPFSIHQLLQ